MNAEEILKKISVGEQQMSWSESCVALNDLSYVLLPFDQSGKEFRQLLQLIRRRMAESTAGVKNY